MKWVNFMARTSREVIAVKVGTAASVSVCMSYNDTLRLRTLRPTPLELHCAAAKLHTFLHNKTLRCFGVICSMYMR